MQPLLQEQLLMLVHAVPRLPVEEEIIQERHRREVERGKRQATIEAQVALQNARTEALKVRISMIISQSVMVSSGA